MYAFSFFCNASGYDGFVLIMVINYWIYFDMGTSVLSTTLIILNKFISIICCCNPFRCYDHLSLEECFRDIIPKGVALFFFYFVNRSIQMFRFHLFHVHNLEQLHNLFLSLLGNVPHIDWLVTDSTQALNSPYNDPGFCFLNSLM
jgi:hypothetical protein